MYPKPSQQPHPPIHVGGESDAALRRVAAHGQGWYSFNRLPDELTEPLARLDGILGEHGRSRSDVELTVCPYFNPVTAESIEGYRAQGVDRLVVLCLAFDVDTLKASLDQLASSVLEPASA
jgi:alkanesulfonate monooxygenase SsuD/methylene tetrahydromethanopterin reductase-like flavin-dependent oxidoreductase (luciferase family)